MRVWYDGDIDKKEPRITANFSARQLAFSGVTATLVTNRHSQFVTGTGKCGERG